MHWISKGFQKNTNSDISVPGIRSIEKTGVFVVITAFSWSHRCSLQKASYRAGEQGMLQALNEQHQLFQLSSCSSWICCFSDSRSAGDQELCGTAGCWSSHGLLQVQSCPAVTTAEGLRRDQRLSREFAVSSGQRAGEMEQQNETMGKGTQEEQCKGKYRSQDEPPAFRFLQLFNSRKKPTSLFFNLLQEVQGKAKW